MVTGERAAEVSALLARVREWAVTRPDVVALVLAGSFAHDDARMDSDVDILVLTNDKQPDVEGEAWISELGGIRLTKTDQWGPMTERRFVLPSGLEVEMGFAPPWWAATDSVDRGTRRVVEDGISILHDPQGLLTWLQDTCRR